MRNIYVNIDTLNFKIRMLLSTCMDPLIAEKFGFFGASLVKPSTTYQSAANAYHNNTKLINLYN